MAEHGGGQSLLKTHISKSTNKGGKVSYAFGGKTIHTSVKRDRADELAKEVL